MMIIEKIVDVLFEVTKAIAIIAVAFVISMWSYFDHVETRAAKTMIENPGVYSNLTVAGLVVMDDYTYGTFIDESLDSFCDAVFDVIGK